MPACKDPEKEKARRKKLSEGRMGEKNWNYNKKFTQDHCDKIGASLKNRVFTPEWREKLRIAAKKRKMSQSTKDKMSESHSGEKNGFYGRKHTEESKQAIGKKTSERLLETGGAAGENNPMWGKSRELNPAWKGGTSFFPYCYKFNTRRKRAVRNFFGDLCICCGKHAIENILSSGKQRELDVHHVDHDKEQGCSGKSFNLVPLCITCHSKEQHYEEEYKKYINKILEEGFKWGIWSKEQYLKEVMYPE